MAFQRGYQPNPWTSGAPPGQVMSGLMTSGYQQAAGPQNFAPNPQYNLAGSGISWNMQPGNVPNGQLRMGQQANWQQQVVPGNQRQRQNFKTNQFQNNQFQNNQFQNKNLNNKRNANWNDGGNQLKRQNKGPNQIQMNSNQGPRINQQQNNNLQNKGNLNRNQNNQQQQQQQRNLRSNFNNNQNPNNKNNNQRPNQQQNIKRNQNQRGNKQHVAQKTAEGLVKKDYPIKKATGATPVKNDDFDSIQAQYVVSVFGYCCKLCEVFLKDKAARNEHSKEEAHTEKFKVAEEEKKAKKAAKLKAKAEEKAAEENGEKAEQANGEAAPVAAAENGTEPTEEEEPAEEQEEEDEEQAEDAATENGNEETEEADSSEVTEESKNLQQSIQQDLSTETTPAKKGVQAKKNFKPQTGTGPRGGKAKAPANRGRGGPRGKRAAN